VDYARYVPSNFFLFFSFLFLFFFLRKTSLRIFYVRLGEHVRAESLSADSVEKKFTWTLLQALLHYPIMFSKALLLIEHGPAGMLKRV